MEKTLISQKNLSIMGGFLFMSNSIFLRPEQKFSKLKEISIAPLIEKELKKLL